MESDPINQLQEYKPDFKTDFTTTDHHLSNENVHPDLHPTHQISTAPGRYNPYPVTFTRTDLTGDHTHDPQADSPTDNPITLRNGLVNALSRTSVMLGEDGLPIPDEMKPAQGTAEWQRMRRINHKEVERKRRQTINEGIDELGRLIANTHSSAEKNKGAVLHKACLYINELKNNENANIEKYTMEKLLCDQTIAELQAANSQLLQQLQQSQQRGDLWKAVAQGDESARNQAESMDV